MAITYPSPGEDNLLRCVAGQSQICTFATPPPSPGLGLNPRCRANPPSCKVLDRGLVPRRTARPQVRTNWHDLLGRYCPRFGVDGMVRNLALPTRPVFITITDAESHTTAVVSMQCFHRWSCRSHGQ